MALQTVSQPAKNSPRDRWDDKDLIPVEIERDRWDRPLIVPPDGGKPVAYRRASGYCGYEYQGGLHDWQKRHLLVNVAKRPDLVLSGQSVQDADDPAVRKDLNGWVKSALDPTLAKARIGTALHRLTEQVDATGQIPPVGEHVPALTAYRRVMSSWFEILHSEAFLVNDELGAAGTADRFVRLKVWMQPCDKYGNPVGEPLPPGTQLVLDLKTSGSAEYFGAKFATQLKVYHGGQLYDLRTGERSSPGELDPRWALILHMPAGGAVAELYWVDLAVGAYAAELAREVYEVEKAAKGAIGRAVIEPWSEECSTCGLSGKHDEECSAVGSPAPALVATSPSPVLAAATHAGQVFDRVRSGAEAQRLFEAIGRCKSQRELLELRAANEHLWNERLNEYGGERFAALPVEVAS